MSRNLLVACILGVLLLGAAALYLGSSSSTAPVSPPAATDTESLRGQEQDTTSIDNAEQEENVPPIISPSEQAKEYEGVHIMPDGTVMAGDGNVIPNATVLANGTITLSDGTIITPVLDMRSEAATSDDAPQHHVFDIVGVNFEYDIKQLKVKKGDTVTINFKSNEGYHDWVVDEFDAATERVNDGGITSVTFVADKVGTFQYYCSVMNHRQQGMIGYLIVEER